MKIALPAAATLLILAAPAHAGAGEDALAHLERIAALDDAGPGIGAVIVSIAPEEAAAQATAFEMAGLPLAGRTVLVRTTSTLANGRQPRAVSPWPGT